MRVELRVAEDGGHALHQLVGGGVLQPLRLGVDPIPGVAKPLDQVRLDHPVTPDDTQRLALALLAQPHAMIRHVFH